jgi:hypothetical protein
MITAVKSASVYESLNVKPSIQKSQSQQDYTQEIKKLEEESSGVLHGDLGTPYTLPLLNESIQERTSKLENIFSSGLSELVKEVGISAEPSFELSTDMNGHVRVKGEHPQKGEIEKLFSDNPELENLFRGICSNHALLKAFEEHQKFSEEYAIDQIQAVMKYSYLFEDSSSVDVTAKIDKNGFATWSAKKLI